MLSDCLESLVPFSEDFEQIWISVNGNSACQDYQTCANWVSQNNRGNVTILLTGSELTALEHAKFYLSRMSELGVKSGTSVANLFHDDVVIQAPPRIKHDEVLLGNWLVGDSKLNNLAETSNPEVVSAQKWIDRLGFHGIFTNGSGMIASWQVHWDVANFIDPKLQGARYEYMLATHRSIETIVATRSPWVLVRTHGLQAGSRVTVSNRSKSELSFLSWLIKNNRIRGVRGLRPTLFLLASWVWQKRKLFIR